MMASGTTSADPGAARRTAELEPPADRAWRRAGQTSRSLGRPFRRSPSLRPRQRLRWRFAEGCPVVGRERLQSFPTAGYYSPYYCRAYGYPARFEPGFHHPGLFHGRLRWR